MSYKNLKDEISNDPNGAGYSTMTDQRIVDELNKPDKVQLVSGISSSRLLEVIDPVAFGLLNAGDLARLDILLSSGSININNPTIKAEIETVFQAGQKSHTAIYALKDELVTRASQLGITSLSKQIVYNARTGSW